jgi:hypothetical protein
MKTVTFLEKTNTGGQPIKIGKQLILNATKAQQKTEKTNSIYVRTGFLNGTPFLSQRGNGAGGAGDIIKLNLDENVSVEVSASLFDRIKTFAEKNNLIVKK